MGSEAPSSTAAANPISPTSSISPSKETGGLEARSEAPAAVADDYETAPEPEDSDVKAPLAANEKGGDPTRVLNPNLVVVEEKDRIEMESLHDEKVDEDRVVEDGKGEVLGGGSIVEDGKVEVLGGGSIAEDGKVEVLGGGSILEDGKGEVLGGGSIVENGKGEVLGGGSIVEDGKGEVLGGGSIVEEGKDEVLGGRWKEECPNSVAVVEVEGESKVEVNGEGESNYKGKGEGFDRDDGSLEESKSIEVGAEAGVEKKDEGNGESELVAAVPLPLEGEKFGMEKETESKPVAEAEAEEVVAGDIVGSEAAAEAKKLDNVEVKLNGSAEVQKLDNVEESKAAESADSVALSEKGTEIVDELPGPKAWEEDKSTSIVVAEDGEVNDSADEAAVPKDALEDIGVLEADKNEAVDGAVSQRSLEQETVAEKPLFNSDQVLADLEVKPGDGGGDLSPHQNVEPSPALGEGFKSKKAEVEPSGTSVAVEGGTASESSGDSMLQEAEPDAEVSSVEKAEPDAEVSYVADDDENPTQNEAEEEEEEDNVSDQQPRVAILDSSETAKEIIKERENGSSSASFEISRSFQPSVDGQQIVSDSDEEGDTEEEGDGKEELFDHAALVAMLNTATGGSSAGNITLGSQDGSSASALRPAPSRPTLFGPSGLAVTAEPENEMDEEERKLHEKVEAIRVKFLRLVMRLGHTSEDTVVANVLDRLSLAEWIRRGGQMGGAFSIESAKKKAIQLEEEGKEDLNFSCNILVLGKTGVGKSATINSIFGEEKSRINAFQAATTSVREISGVVDGVKIRVIDTPGLESSVMDQATNRRILSSIKKYTKKCPPDIVLYMDRLDTQTQDLNDLPLLRSITSALGSSLWFNAIVALTHAASPPPEGPSGPLNYEMFIDQRSYVVQHSIRQAARDMRVITPVALVENHPWCRRNREGERVLPNGISWRPRLLLLCYASKILSEANTVLKLRDPSPGKLSGFRLRFKLLPHLLFTLLQSRTYPRLSNDQGGDSGDPDIGLDDFSDEEEYEYDQLPPFKPLKKSQLAMLTKEQKRAYIDEYDYRVKLLQKKQFKEEIRRLNEMKKKGKSRRDEDSPYGGDDVGEEFDEDGAPAAVQVPLRDMVLPPSFDCDTPTYRYRFLEPTSQLLTGPVLDTHSWDHDCGYDGVALEKSLAIANRFPAAVAGQITKDKKDFSIHLDSSVAAKLGENGSALAGFDIQPIGEHLAYILQGEAKFKNLKKNKTAAGMSVTFVGDTVATGLKVEDQLMIGKRVGLMASTGAVKAQGDVAYGANLEARLREEDYPIGQTISTLGLSLMKLHGVLALEANLQSQLNVGRNSKMAVRVVLNNKRSGRITIKTSTSEQLQLALVGILPVALSIFRRIWPGESEYSH